MAFAEFDAKYELPKTDVLKVLGRIFGKCEASLTENPIFWLRLTGYTFACAELIQSEPVKALGFTAREAPIEDMILAAGDKYIKARLKLYIEKLTETLNEDSVEGLISLFDSKDNSQLQSFCPSL